MEDQKYIALVVISIALLVRPSQAQVCQGFADIIIAIDDSDSTQRPDGSGGSTLAPGEITLAEYFIQNSLLGEDSDIRLAIMAHSSTARILQSYTTNTTSLGSSLDFTAENGGSNTATALRIAINLHLSHSRPGAERIVILLIDSGTSDPFNTLTQSVRAKNNKISVFPVAFGNAGNPASISNLELGMLGAYQSAYLRVNSDLQLVDIADTIFSRACPLNAPLPTTTASPAATSDSSNINTKVCQGKADIVIAIDDSLSTQRAAPNGGVQVAPGEFQLAEYYIQNSLLNGDNINLAFVAHSSTGRVLSQFSINEAALQTSLTFTPEYQDGNTATGLSVSNDLHISSGRSGVPKYTILLLDSGTNNPFNTFSEAARARTNDIYVLPVAFSNAVNSLELGLLGANNAAFEQVDSDGALLSLVDSLNSVICPVLSTETTAASTTVTTTSAPTTEPVTTPQTSDACQGFADIVFAIDDSSGTQRSVPGGGIQVAPGQFQLAKYYIYNSLLNIANINIAFVAHSDTGRTLSGFSSDRAQLASSLTFTPEYRGSNTAVGLDASTDLHTRTGRSGAAKYTVLLVESGTSNAINTFTEAARARFNGIRVIPVAFNNRVSNLELGQLGFDMNSYLRVNTDNDLINLVSSLSNIICPALGTTIATTTAAPTTTTAPPTTTIPPTTPSSSDFCQGYADIVFAVDDSSSAQRPDSNGGVQVAPGQFRLAEYFIYNSLLDQTNINIAFVAHSGSGRILSTFSADKATLTSSLDFTPEYQGSNTAVGLDASTDLHIRFGRPGAARFTILFVESGTSDSLTTLTEAARARLTGIYVIPIAFNSRVSVLELSQIGYNNKAYYRVNSDADLVDLASVLARVICPALATTVITTTIAPSTTPPITNACQGYADIVIALDDSSSAQRRGTDDIMQVAPGQFRLAEYFIYNSLLDLSNVNLAFVAHSNTGRVLSSFATDRAVLTSSLSFTPEYQGSNTASGIGIATDLHLQFGRPWAAKYTVLLVDSGTSDTLATYTEAARARFSGVYVAPVAFSSRVSVLELSQLGYNNKAYFRVNGDDDLISLADVLSDVICPGPNPTWPQEPTTTTTPAATTTAAATTTLAPTTTRTTLPTTTTALLTTTTVPPTSTATVNVKACTGLADIIIAIDDSLSTQRTSPSGGVEVARGQMQLAEYYILNSLLDVDNINIAILAHSDTARVLSDFSNDTIALAASLIFTPEYGDSDTTSALRASTDLHASSGRPGAAKFTLLLVDAATTSPFTTFTQAARARNDGVYVVPIAFSNSVTSLELGLLGANDRAFYTVTDHTDLLNLVTELNTVICPGPPPTSTVTPTTTAAPTTTTVLPTTTTPLLTTTTTPVPTTTVTTTAAPTTTTIPTTVATTAAVATSTCEGFADIIIAIDDSAEAQRSGGVLASGQYDMVRYFIRNSVLNSANVNLGLVAYSDAGRTLSALTDDASSLESALDSLTPSFGSNNHAAGLSTCVDLQEGSTRPAARKSLIFLVTASSTNIFATFVLAARARSSGIEVIPVAFGNDGTRASISDLELGLLGKTEGSWLRVNDDLQLTSLVDEIMATICPGPLPTQSTTPGTTTEPTSTVPKTKEPSTAPPTTTTTAVVTTSPTTVSTLPAVTVSAAPCSILGDINSVVHFTDPNDVAKYLQCSKNAEGEVIATSNFCRFGTMWNDAIGTCSSPVDVTRDPCRSLSPGDVRQYGLQCNAYWECVGPQPYSNVTCCGTGQSFDGSTCVTDSACTAPCPLPDDAPFPDFCPYSASPAGSEYYRVYTQSFIIDKACPAGLTFDPSLCYCNGSATDFCSEDLRLTFENKTIVDYSKNQQFMTFYPLERFFPYPSDTLVTFWGPNYIIVPGFANKQFRKISVVVGFEPTGASKNQVLIHNGPMEDPAGPSVQILITDGTAGNLDVYFTLVLSADPDSATPMILTLQKGGPIEARLLYDGYNVTASVLKSGAVMDSLTRSAAVTDDFVALRRGAFNIGGGACLDCNNFLGNMDYVKVFDCAAKSRDLGEAAAVSARDIVTPYDTSLELVTPDAQYITGPTSPSADDNLAQCQYADFFNGIAHVSYSGDCGKFLQCQMDTNFVFNVTIMDCPFGTLWSSSQQACSMPFQSECDPCKSAADNSRYSYSDYCGSYLQCKQGVSQVKCCADGEVYDESQGCVTDTLNACQHSCAATPTSAYTCYLSTSTLGEGFYYELLYQIDRPCPPGLGFNQSDCGCTNPIETAPSTCRPYVDLRFDLTGAQDYSMNNFSIDESRVSINDGEADFSNSQANIQILGTANIQYHHSQFGLTVNFTAPSTLRSSQTIVYNGRLGTETPSFKLSINTISPSTILVSFLLVTENDGKKTNLDVTASSTGEVYATLVFDGSQVTARTVSSQGTSIATRAAAGQVLRKQGAMNIGSGLCFAQSCNPFSGTISNVKLFLCQPSL